MNYKRYLAVMVLLCSATGLLYARGDKDNVPSSAPVGTMPNTIGPWVGHDIPIGQNVLDVLGKGDFVERSYSRSDGVPSEPIDLFVGYFATQRTGQTIHSPQHCLPGAGWTFESSTYKTIKDEAGKDYQVGEYVITNGEIRQFVLYWYQAHGRSVANEYVSKFYLIADAIRLNRTDGALVRVITPIAPNEDVASARQRALSFTREMAPHLDSVIPR